MMSEKQLTTNAGRPVADNQNVETAGTHGPALLQNVWFMEKQAHFNRERIPERIAHAKGSGAYGTFTVTHDITRYTKAKIFSEVGKKTDLFVRFSVVAGSHGDSDTERDVRGFAIKFYTEEGNWDLVGNNTPVFFVRDPLKFADFIHTQKRDPEKNLFLPVAKWDFWSLMPESLHQVMILMGDRGIPQSYRHMHGFGSHTYSFINAENERFWVKFHLLTQQGIANYTTEESREVSKYDRDHAQRDLFESIERGDFPRWKLYVQIMPEQEALTYHINPFDLTKVWPHGDYPLEEVGVLELNRNPKNYFRDVEQSAFDPAHIVPGIGFSPDRMLQGRLFAYSDAHRHRLGINYFQIPVNRSRCKMANYHRDGLMRVDDNGGDEKNYEPNSFGGPVDDVRLSEPPLSLEGYATNYNHREDNDYYSQPRAFYRLQSPDAQERLIRNVVDELEQVPEYIQVRAVARFFQADEECGMGMARELGIERQIILDEVAKQQEVDSCRRQKTDTPNNISNNI